MAAEPSLLPAGTIAETPHPHGYLSHSPHQHHAVTKSIWPDIAPDAPARPRMVCTCSKHIMIAENGLHFSSEGRISWTRICICIGKPTTNVRICCTIPGRYCGVLVGSGIVGGRFVRPGVPLSSAFPQTPCATGSAPVSSQPIAIQSMAIGCIERAILRRCWPRSGGQISPGHFHADKPLRSFLIRQRLANL